jgi:putative FmdB family regulatory protein
MPTYDYECSNGHRFELFQRISDEPVTECPECGAPAHRKISGGAGFLFKGDGFYITDYRSDEYKKKASAEGASGSSSADTGPKSEKKSEKKGGETSTGSSSTD